MKCDGLTIYDGQWCDKSEVEEAIAELKKFAEDACLERDDNQSAIDELQSENEQFKAKLESVQASAYADSVDAGMRERRLKRALWLARANNAINSYDKWNLFANFESEDKLFTIDEYDETPGVTDFSTLRTYAEWCKVWQNVGRKCLKKAEEYK